MKQGYVRQRSKGTWTVVVNLVRDPVTGKRRQLTRTVRGTRAEAEAECIKILHERNSGLHQAPNKITVAEYLKHWLAAYAEPNTAPRTYERYAALVRRNLIPALGRHNLMRLRPTHIQSYYAAALKSGRADGRGGLSAQTVVHLHRVFREALQQAVKWQILPRNPADAVTPPRPVRREMRVLDPKEIARLMDTCDDDDLRTLIFVALSTGLREGELLALRWSDVDLKEGHLQVTRTLHYLTNKGLQFGEPKTRRSRRRVALSKETARVLAMHRTRQLERRLLLGSAYADNDLIFATEVGEPVKPYSISPRFKRVVRKAKLGQMRFHDLRHTSASLLLAAGIHPKVVSERLGHSTVNLTLDTYSHVLPGLQEQAAQSMDAYLPKAR